MVTPQSYYESRYTPSPVRNIVWKHIADYLNPQLNIQSDSTIVELGAGHGAWIRCMPGHRHALDIHPDIEKIFKEEGIQGVQLHVGSCTKLDSFRESSVDLILMSNLLEHLEIEEASACLLECQRVLKVGATICLIQPNFALCPKNYFDDFTHRTIFTHVGLADFVCAHGFEVKRLWKRFVPFSLKSKSGRLHFLLPLYLRSPIKPFAAQMALIAQKRR